MGDPLWEVFVRPRRGLSHGHVGSLHAPDAEMALRNARDVYTRRQGGGSVWAVPAGAVTASSPPAPPGAETAPRPPRDVRARRQEGVSIWVVPAAAITASSPDAKEAFFDPA